MSCPNRGGLPRHRAANAAKLTVRAEAARRQFTARLLVAYDERLDGRPANGKRRQIVRAVPVDQQRGEPAAVRKSHHDAARPLVKQVRASQHQAERLVDRDQRAAAGAAIGDADAAVCRRVARGCRINRWRRADLLAREGIDIALRAYRAACARDAQQQQ